MTHAMDVARRMDSAPRPRKIIKNIDDNDVMKLVIIPLMTNFLLLPIPRANCINMLAKMVAGIARMMKAAYGIVINNEIIKSVIVDTITIGVTASNMVLRILQACNLSLRTSMRKRKIDDSRLRVKSGVSIEI
jgi:hypothetical protein